jgi:hypothetical protein
LSLKISKILIPKYIKIGVLGMKIYHLVTLFICWSNFPFITTIL